MINPLDQQPRSSFVSRRNRRALFPPLCSSPCFAVCFCIHLDGNRGRDILLRPITKLVRSRVSSTQPRTQPRINDFLLRAVHNRIQLVSLRCDSSNFFFFFFVVSPNRIFGSNFCQRKKMRRLKFVFCFVMLVMGSSNGVSLNCEIVCFVYSKNFFIRRIKNGG